MTIAVIVLGALATLAVVAWFFLVRKHPENAASHETSPRTGSAQYFGDTNDRPGSPGAEADGSATAGQPAPGPSAESVEGRGDRRPR